MDVLILSSKEGDWQGLYINGNLIDEGHTLGEGNNFYYLLEKAELYGFKRCEVRSDTLNNYDDDMLCDMGYFPKKTTYLNGKY